MKECSDCGYPVEESDRFCGNCRAAVEGMSNIEQRMLNSEVEEPSCSLSLRGENLEEQPVVRLEANVSRVLLEGSVLPLDFRLHSQDELSKVELSIRSANGISACNRVAQFVSGADIHLDIAIPKGCSGTLGFEVALKYGLDGKAVEQRGNCRPEICPAAGDGNITVDIKQGHAGDIQVSGLQELAAMNDKRTLLRELNAIEPRWENLPMQQISKIGIENGHEKRVLETENGPLWLLCGTHLTFGRARENDIVTRLASLSSALLDPANPSNPNRFMSSHHGWLHRTEEGVFVVDGAMVGGKPSGGGTYLDGKRVVREKLPQNSVILSLSGKEASLPTIYSLRITASEEGVVLRPQEPRAGAFLWLFGKLEFEGSIYEHRTSGFFRDGKNLTANPAKKKE